MYLDVCSRPNKNKNMQTFCIASHNNINYVAITALVASFNKNSELTYLDVINIFHEFAHSLFHIFNNTDYSILSGINSAGLDFIKIPALVLENLCYTEDVFIKLFDGLVDEDKIEDKIEKEVDKEVKNINKNNNNKNNIKNFINIVQVIKLKCFRELIKTAILDINSYTNTNNTNNTNKNNIILNNSGLHHIFIFSKIISDDIFISKNLLNNIQDFKNKIMINQNIQEYITRSNNFNNFYISSKTILDAASTFLEHAK